MAAPLTYCGSNLVSDRWCEKALALIAASFRTAVSDGANLEARSSMMLRDVRGHGVR